MPRRTADILRLQLIKVDNDVVVVVVVDRLWPVRARFQTGAINTGKILSKSAVEKH